MSTLSSQYTLQIPDDWTPEQALAVYDFLNELAGAIWQRYQCPLMEQLASEQDQHDDRQIDLIGFDDPLPF